MYTLPLHAQSPIMTSIFRATCNSIRYITHILRIEGILEQVMEQVKNKWKMGMRYTPHVASSQHWEIRWRG